MTVRFLNAFFATFILLSPLNANEKEFKKALKELGVEESTITYIIENLTSRNPETVRQIGGWLRAQGISDLGNIFHFAPAIVGISVPLLESKAQWFREKGVSDFGGFISRNPQLLTKSIGSYQERWDWLIRVEVKDP